MNEKYGLNVISEWSQRAIAIYVNHNMLFFLLFIFKSSSCKIDCEHV